MTPRRSRASGQTSETRATARQLLRASYFILPGACLCDTRPSRWPTDKCPSYCDGQLWRAGDSSSKMLVLVGLPFDAIVREDI